MTKLNTAYQHQKTLKAGEHRNALFAAVFFSGGGRGVGGGGEVEGGGGGREENTETGKETNMQTSHVCLLIVRNKAR